MSLLSRGLVINFDISYTIYRFTTQTPKSSRTSCYFYFSKMYWNCLFPPLAFIWIHFKFSDFRLQYLICCSKANAPYMVWCNQIYTHHICWENLVQKLKIVSLSWNLIPRLIQRLNLMLMFTFSVFDQKYLFNQISSKKSKLSV